MLQKRHIEVMKEPRWVRKLVAGKTGTFFADLALWPVKPSHVSSVAPKGGGGSQNSHSMGGFGHPPVFKMVRGRF